MHDLLGEYAGAGRAGTRHLPPVDKWSPPDRGFSGIEIKADGSWWHEGARMTRESLVRLFSTILRKDEDGKTWLVTPVERMWVAVEDAPFLAIRADRVGQGDRQIILFTTNVGDSVAAGPENPIRVSLEPATQEPRPYVLVRGRLEARILRPAFYEMADWIEQRNGAAGVSSLGAFFPLGPRP